ncbi:MAG TPA: bifunctional diguanylate cyclase/phosphodiesterase [Caulobacteraceae bacterium]|nr:bifunctional diguanylate cyclase/phosphodiesterase [Caulobacteraceae bacterium]
MAQDRFIWDATAVLEALGAAEVALWTWEPERDRLRLSGAARVLGLGPLAPECSSAAVMALSMPQDRSIAEEALQVQEPGTEIHVRMTMRGGESCIWRGVWLEEGVRASGVIVPESRFGVSEFDKLTGLLDRKSFVERLRTQIQQPGAYELVVADINRLRRLNEALGHERADLVIAALGSRLAAAFPSSVLMARIGEDEFALCAPLGGISQSEAIRQALEQPLRVAGFDIHPTLSIGAVRCEGGSDAPEAAEMLRRAEVAVEAAKNAGKGGAVADYGRALETDGLTRLALESDLRGAFTRGEIEPFFQPVVKLETGAISGFEALARWRHPRRGIVPPDEFLPMCADLGLMVDLGKLMMRASALQLAEWRDRHEAAHNLTCSVNLSTGDLDRLDLVQEVEALIKETGLPKSALKLEITEGDIMRDPEYAAVVLRNLREAGAGLSLDDFGTGFSSLSYLTRLPFDTLKVDRYFVRTMGANEGSAKIVRSVINLGRELSLEVVAEGVENAAMARHLMELGCHYGQGFGYAPALSAQEAEVYLNEAYADGVAPVKARG